MVFWTNYRKCFLATCISVMGGIVGLIGVSFLFEGFSENPVAAIAGGILGVAGFVGLRKFADIVAARKYARMAEKGKL